MRAYFQTPTFQINYHNFDGCISIGYETASQNMGTEENKSIIGSIRASVENEKGVINFGLLNFPSARGLGNENSDTGESKSTKHLTPSVPPAHRGPDPSFEN
ncbi:hypothetical protein GH714_003151 [Hevea brasiliensis]|uniref:Uncharacterized protein n=1 Tax=Hevea brasiliensis TaxID=3981 RepID=A0A6A6LUR9_HEVBR|nr:hypothetical protein GH714_003151 [Hevea brasiliensis]